jgi:N-acyl homoserine lactone hydrolase
MKRFSPKTVVLLFPLSLGACAGIGVHPIVPAALPSAPATAAAPRTWDEVFAHPVALEVIAHNTGTVLTGPRVLIDASDPRTPSDQKVEQWVPALSYLVRHPTQGDFLMDAGMREADAAGHCDFGVKPFFWASCKTERGQDIASQLRAGGVEPARLRFVLISHLHGDHAGGLHALGKAGPLHLLLAPEEWKAATRTFRLFDGYVHDLLDGPYDVALLPVERAVSMPLVGASVDLFGDGSVWVFPMPGHSRGEVAVLLNAEGGPLLFTFDTAHLRAGLEHGVTPGFTVDKPEIGRAHV